MTSEHTQKNKEIVWRLWQALDEATPESVGTTIEDTVHEDIFWHGPHPINELCGRSALISEFWQPILHAFPDLRRRCDIFLGGNYEEQEMVGATGYFTGTFTNNWLGIPASNQATDIRFGEFSFVENDKIVETFILLDILDVLRQCGFQLVKRWLDEEGDVPGPATGDGVLLEPQDDTESQKSLELTLDMLNNLAKFDGQDWSTQNKEHFWHPNMIWYGPTGIGTVRGLRPFEEEYQTIFRRGLPDFEGVGHFAEIAEGNYCASGGYPSAKGTHLGEFIGCPPTGKVVTMRVMDFWRREGDLLMENWVFIDLIHFGLQLELDIFEELRKKTQNTTSSV